MTPRQLKSSTTASTPPSSHDDSCNFSSDDDSVAAAEKKYMINQDKAVVVTTPYSTGVNLAQEISNMGFRVICLWNKGFSPEMKLHVPLACTNLRYFAEIEEGSSLQETEQLVREAALGREIVAVVCGGEAGVDLADALSFHMGLLSNGTDVANRRDKKCQQELIRAVGLRATRQAGGGKWSDVEDFLLREDYPVIVKPVDSAGCKWKFGSGESLRE